MTIQPTSRAITEVAELEALGLTSADQRETLEAVTHEFRLRLTPQVQSAMIAPDDPVARQYIPDAREKHIRPEELYDPIGDRAHEPVKGLTHRYPDRVIFHVTKSCEVYCRFCFRREVVGDDGLLSAPDVDAALDYIARTPQIHEVILTGGDPMGLSARRIKDLISRLSAIEHVGLVRLHSRVPVVSPARIDAAMIEALNSHRPDMAVWVVVHTNHAQEINAAAAEALAKLAEAGIPLLSQSVLLRGINDTVQALTDLFRNLLRHRVKPYYLHHCDLARGTSHFRTTIQEGRALMRALRGTISGSALPTYVLDIPGGYGKVPINGDYFTPIGNGLWQVEDPKGQLHRYQDPER